MKSYQNTINGLRRQLCEADPCAPGVLVARSVLCDLLDAAERCEPNPCKLPPPGWACTRPAPHDGPCAAVPCPHANRGVGERTACPDPDRCCGKPRGKFDFVVDVRSNFQPMIDELRRVLECLEGSLERPKCPGNPGPCPFPPSPSCPYGCR